MAWQDILLSIGNYLFVVALLPSVFGTDKPALSSSLMTGAVLGCFTVIYASLSLWSASIAVGLSSFVWFVLAYQQWRRR
jgi:hypothetical protein